MRNCSVKNTEERILVIKERKIFHKPFRCLDQSGTNAEKNDSPSFCLRMTPKPFTKRRKT